MKGSNQILIGLARHSFISCLLSLSVILMSEDDPTILFDDFVDFYSFKTLEDWCLLDDNGLMAIEGEELAPDVLPTLPVIPISHSSTTYIKNEEYIDPIIIHESNSKTASNSTKSSSTNNSNNNNNSRKRPKLQKSSSSSSTSTATIPSISTTTTSNTTNNTNANDRMNVLKQAPNMIQQYFNIGDIPKLNEVLDDICEENVILLTSAMNNEETGNVHCICVLQYIHCIYTVYIVYIYCILKISYCVCC